MLLGVVPRRQTGCFGPGSRSAGWSASLVLSGVRPARPACLGLTCAAIRSAALGPGVGQVASGPGVHSPEVSGEGALPGFQVWAPSPLIRVLTTRLPLSVGAAYPVFTIQGLRGEGWQRPWLLWRVL